MTRYFYSQTGADVQGPLTDEDLLELLSSGALDEATQVAAEGSEVWQPIAALRPLPVTSFQGPAASEPRPHHAILIPGLRILRSPNKEIASPRFLVIERLEADDVRKLGQIIERLQSAGGAGGCHFVLAFREFAGADLSSVLDEGAIATILLAEDNDALTDLAVATRARLWAIELGLSLDEFEVNDAGTAEMVASAPGGILLGVAPGKDGMQCYLDSLLRRLKRTKDHSKRLRIQHRYAAMSGGSRDDFPEFEAPSLPEGYDIVIQEGYASGYFVTDAEECVCEFQACLALVSAMPLLEMSIPATAETTETGLRVGSIWLPSSLSREAGEGDATQLVCTALARAHRRDVPTILIAPQFGVPVISTCIVNRLRGSVQVCLVRSHGCDAGALNELARKLGAVAVADLSHAWTDEEVGGILGECAALYCTEDSCLIRTKAIAARSPETAVEGRFYSPERGVVWLDVGILKKICSLSGGNLSDHQSISFAAIALLGLPRTDRLTRAATENKFKMKAIANGGLEVRIPPEYL